MLLKKPWQGVRPRAVHETSQERQLTSPAHKPKDQIPADLSPDTEYASDNSSCGARMLLPKPVLGDSQQSSVCWSRHADGLDMLLPSPNATTAFTLRCWALCIFRGLFYAALHPDHRRPERC